MKSGIINSTVSWLEHLGPVKLALGLTATVLVVDHLVAPKGMSMVTKTITKITGAERSLMSRARAPLALPAGPVVIPPPGVGTTSPVHATGANNGPGWGRGGMPYFPGAHANPGGPWPYAHAGGAARYGWE